MAAILTFNLYLELHVTRPESQKPNKAGEGLELLNEMEVIADKSDDVLYEYQGVTYSREDIINWFRYNYLVFKSINYEIIS